MKRFFIVFVLLLYAAIEVFGQSEKIHDLKNVVGEYTVMLTENFDTKQIRAEVKNRCKNNAISQVTSEVFKSWTNVGIVNADNGIGAESYTSMLNYNVSMRDGEIVQFDIVDEGQKMGEGEITFYCIANVKVKTGLEPDPEFIVPVKGVKSVYMTGEELHFQFTPYKDCHMMVFLLENERVGYRLLPNAYVQERLYKAKESYGLNENSRSYIEFGKTPGLEVEYNKLIFLFTLRKWAIDENVQSTKEIEEWIARIPNNEKYIHQQVIEIRDF